MSNIKQNAVVLASYSLGFLLVAYGLYATGKSGMEMLRGSTKEAEKKILKETTTNTLPANTITTYKLQFSGDHWEINDYGSLPNFLPGPPMFNPPGRPLTPSEIGDLFLRTMERNRFQMNRDEYYQLVALNLAGETVFREKNRLAKLVHGGIAEAGVQKEVQPVPEQTAKVLIDPNFDPSKPEFFTQMKAWKTRVEKRIRKSSRYKNKYVLNYADPDGNGQVRMYLTKKSVNRIRANNFGSQKQDKAIYLQILMNMDGFQLDVDGAFGPKSRASLSQWAQKRFGSSTATYMNLVKKHL